MKPYIPLLLPVALLAAMSLSACNRNPTPATSADTAAPAAVEPAPAEPVPVEPAPAPMASAPAAPAMADSGMSFTDMDKNKDGGITPDELASTEMLSQHFTQADADGDGKLTQAEVDKHRADMAAMPGN